MAKNTDLKCGPGTTLSPLYGGLMVPATNKVVYFNNKCVPVLVGPRHFPGYIERHICGPDIIKNSVRYSKGITKTFSLTFSKYP